jgi:hypothetical protein
MEGTPEARRTSQARHRCGQRCLGLALVLIGLAGCGDDASRYREVAREQLAIMQEMVQVLKSVTDEASVHEARAKLQDLQQRAAAAAARGKALPLAPAAQEQVASEYGERLREALSQQLAEVRRIEALPGGADLLDKLGLLPKSESGKAGS